MVYLWQWLVAGTESDDDDIVDENDDTDDGDDSVNTGGEISDGSKATPGVDIVTIETEKSGTMSVMGRGMQDNNYVSETLHLQL